MAAEVIEGTIAPTEPKRSKRGYCLFDPLTITDKKGGKRDLPKVSAGGEIATAIRSGAKGRFYLGKNAGMAGIHGMRLADGTSIYAKYHNFELILMIGAVAGAAMLLIGYFDPGNFMITPVVTGAALGAGWFIIRQGRIADQKAFESDASKG